MVGTYFINCWASLFAFTIYFLITFQNGVPFNVIIGSFIVALITFVLMYPFRLLLGYILYTPKDHIIEELEKSIETYNNEETNSTTNFTDESPEDIAQVVRNMINQDETMSTN